MLLLKYFDYVQFYVIRRNFTVEKALFRVFKHLLNNWKKLFDRVNRVYRIFSSQTITNALKDANDQLETLAEFAKELIKQESNRTLTSLAIDNEFNVQLLLKDTILLIGKIDLVTKWKDGLMFIELKSGHPNEWHSNQLRLYYEIFRKNHRKIPINLRLWNIKPKPIDKARSTSKNYSKCTDLKVKSKNLIQILEQNLDFSKDIKKVSDLPAEHDSHFDHMCDNCDICEKLLPELFPSEFPNQMNKVIRKKMLKKIIDKKQKKLEKWFKK